MIILGISGLYHDSAAAILENNRIVAAAQEERFTRKKQDNSLPVNAIKYCLQIMNIGIEDVDAVIYYDNPILTLDRYISNVLGLGENASFLIEKNFENVITSRMSVDKMFRKHFGIIGKNDRIYVCEHHISHAASAFYPSPFETAAILTIDGVGEWATTTIGVGKKSEIKIIEEIDYPHSLGLLYSTFTSFCGFKVNSGDYKFMGLAPYGEPVYCDLIRNKLIDVKDDGSYRLNLDYFDFYKNEYMYNDKFAQLFDGPARLPESRITRREMNIAASVQKLTEEIIILLAKHAKEVTGENNLVMAGGVALNCVANGKILKEKIFENIWIQPAAGDAGGALGCALYAAYNMFAVERLVDKHDSQQGTYLGPEFSSDEIEKYLIQNNYNYSLIEDNRILCKIVAANLANGKVVGWFQGRMEYGPRALGNRSILGDARSEKMQSILNLKIKYRESFRPFAPSVLKERVNEYFEMNCESPYMLLVSDVKEERREKFDKENFLKEYDDDMLPVVNAKRSDIPAVTHIDYSARVQTVDKSKNPKYYMLIEEFERLTGYGVIINTSFNVRGEPIVCSPEDAYRCFMRTEMDVLVLGNHILYKEQQRPYEEDTDWRNEYELD